MFEINLNAHTHILVMIYESMSLVHYVFVSGVLEGHIQGRKEMGLDRIRAGTSMFAKLYAYFYSLLKGMFELLTLTLCNCRPSVL